MQNVICKYINSRICKLSLFMNILNTWKLFGKDKMFWRVIMEWEMNSIQDSNVSIETLRNSRKFHNLGHFAMWYWKPIPTSGFRRSEPGYLFWPVKMVTQKDRSVNVFEIFLHIDSGQESLFLEKGYSGQILSLAGRKVKVDVDKFGWSDLGFMSIFLHKRIESHEAHSMVMPNSSRLLHCEDFGQTIGLAGKKSAKRKPRRRRPGLLSTEARRLQKWHN